MFCGPIRRSFLGRVRPRWNFFRPDMAKETIQADPNGLYFQKVMVQNGLLLAKSTHSLVFRTKQLPSQTEKARELTELHGTSRRFAG